MGNRIALCVGVNNYKNLPSAALQGCVNDVKNMESILTKYLGFSGTYGTTADIVELTDLNATKLNIMKNLKDMVDGAKNGKYSYLVFSMSSHGTQVPDTSGDEPDRADEAFCPTDLIQKGNQWDPAHVIVDDELNDLFVQLPKTVLLEVFLDTCHSGSGLKAMDLLLDRKPRYLPPPSWEAFEQVNGHRSYGLRETLAKDGVLHHILWAACRSDQTSADANIAGTWNGAFTYYFCKEMKACKNKLTRKELLVKVRADLLANHYSQTPQLEIEATKRNLAIS
jgi:metacaspase-1